MSTDLLLFSTSEHEEAVFGMPSVCIYECMHAYARR
jgi:hypothetical protein